MIGILIAATWIACSALAAALVGRMIGLADELRQCAALIPDFIPDDILDTVEVEPPRT